MFAQTLDTFSRSLRYKSGANQAPFFLVKTCEHPQHQLGALAGSGDTPASSYRWRAICGGKGWLLRRAEQDQVGRAEKVRPRNFHIFIDG